MSWFNESIMARKGVAKGVAGKSHHISEEVQESTSMFMELLLNLYCM